MRVPSAPDCENGETTSRDRSCPHAWRDPTRPPFSKLIVPSSPSSRASNPHTPLSKPLNSSVRKPFENPRPTRLSLDLSGLSLALLVGHDDVVHVLGPGDLGTGGGEDDLDVTRVSLVRVDSTVGSVSPSSGFLSGGLSRSSNLRQRSSSPDSDYGGGGLSRLTGACCTTMFLMVNSSFSKSLASAFDSAFFNKLRMNRTDFSGHRPVVRHQ